jgi:hypothetical protein
MTPDPFADEYNGFWFNPGSGKYQTQTATYSVDSRQKAWHLNKTRLLNEIFSVKGAHETTATNHAHSRPQSLKLDFKGFQDAVPVPSP